MRILAISSDGAGGHPFGLGKPPDAGHFIGWENDRDKICRCEAAITMRRSTAEANKFGNISNRHLPAAHDRINASPTAKIEVSHTKVAPECHLKSVLQAVPVFVFEKRCVDIVKNRWHCDEPGVRLCQSSPDAARTEKCP
jgi:hypothetical protein